MVTRLPVPYLIDAEEEVPNLYLVGVGAGYVASLVGDALVRDSNAFQSFIEVYSNKTGINFHKGIFGHEIFRRVFILTLANLYSAYSSARSQYLSNSGIEDEYLPLYTQFDDKMLLEEFLGASAKDNLDEILRNNEDLNRAILAKIRKDAARLLNRQQTQPIGVYLPGQS